MAQRNSGYPPVEHDSYPTPSWVTHVLAPHLPARVRRVWEPACGEGAMVLALRGAGYAVRGTDLVHGHDFLTAAPSREPFDAIITNPPYGWQCKLALAFIERALELTKPGCGVVAMLLPAGFFIGKTRRHICDAPAFAKLIVLPDRIVWFERTDGKEEQPSADHAWFLWDWRHQGPPAIAYGRLDASVAASPPAPSGAATHA